MLKPGQKYWGGRGGRGVNSVPIPSSPPPPKASRVNNYVISKLKLYNTFLINSVMAVCDVQCVLDLYLSLRTLWTNQNQIGCNTTQISNFDPRAFPSHLLGKSPGIEVVKFYSRPSVDLSTLKKPRHDKGNWTRSFCSIDKLLNFSCGLLHIITWSHYQTRL